MNLTETLFDNKYQIIGKLGSGGMSTVYLAKDVKLQKLWAIKEVKKNVGVKSLNKVDLMAETNILKKLDHPALPRIVDIINTEESIFVILDYIDGVSLDKRLKEYKVIDEGTALYWAKQICDVLDYLHRQEPNPIIYRDMKPGNLMLTPSGKIKLIDFGIAREYKEDVSQDTTYIGTRGYAAPEQYGSNQTDARTDIYSLGVTLYHLVTGKSPNEPPYEIKPIREVNYLLSEGLEKIIEKCTRQDPNLRYQNVRELWYDLENIHKLNSQYKNNQVKKLVKFYSFLILFFICLVLTINGVMGIHKEKVRQYNAIIDNGNKFQDSGNEDKAIETYKNAINEDSSNADAYGKIIDTYVSQNNIDDCIDFIDNYIIDKNSSVLKEDKLLYKIAMVYFQKKNYDSAYKYFAQIKDGSQVGLEGLKYYKPVAQALGYSTPKTNDDVEKLVKDLADYVNGSMDVDFKINAYITLAGIYRDNPNVFKDNTDKTLEVLEKANSICVNKDNPILYEQLAKAYYDKAIQYKPEPDTYHNYLNKAIDNYKICINAGSKVSDDYYNLGTIYKYLGDFQDSEKIFLQEVSSFGQDYKGYMGLALLYVTDENNNKLKNYDNFKKYYDLAVEKNHNDNDVDFITLQKKYNDLKNQGVIK
ncbi:protein kinase [Clostridium sp. 19966]|uniref:protein kinase domain-containing protein n=1 Tax=Clostridium sp. 19966 TaxID=2768166 RepID=UPI0028DF4619|nr:protein kinase [Clostridium sp. 19966]MDT8718575.1 protein kinase [Clostridium sp. 19966]